MRSVRAGFALGADCQAIVGERVYVLLTAMFWAVFLLPGYALLRGSLPGCSWAARAWGPGQGALLHQVAYGYAFSFLLLSPVSLLCYALGAPLWLFSAALSALVVLAVFGLWRARSRSALRRSWSALTTEAIVPYALLLVLLWLQGRLGGWLDGDATFHLARIRALLSHGFSNRDIYLRSYHFQHAYHSNLLFPVYASAAQLTGQDYLRTWFYAEPWAKLMVAAGHYVLGYSLTKRCSVGYALAICMITLNAGETYTLYPNTLCVGYLLPLLLAHGFESVGLSRRLLARRLLLMAALAWVVAQIHSLYVIYAVLTLMPVGLLCIVRPEPLRTRMLRLAVLCGLASAAPFILVSMYGFQGGQEVASAPDELEPPELEPSPPAGLATKPKPARRLKPALAAGGGHLEKMLESPEYGQVVFTPERMGGRSFVLLGALALLASVGLYRQQRMQLTAAAAAAAWLSVILFTRTGATWGWKVLQAPFIVARLSTVLTSLLVFGACACVLWPAGRLGRDRKLAESLLYLGLWSGATLLLGHSPKSFPKHVQAALAPEPQRHRLLDRWSERRALLTRVVPPGSTVLTTPRFGRYVVMLCDCYVLAADRGHTHVPGIDKRRRDVTFMNSTHAPWQQRQRLIRHYGVRLVTFENRWHRRYRWAYQHGKLLGRSAGQDVIALDLP